MHIVFVTFGNFGAHATLKRATGMAGALSRQGLQVTLLLEESDCNREKVQLECPDASIVWHHRGKTALDERDVKSRSIAALRPDVVWVCGVGPRNWVKRPSKECLFLADHSELFSTLDNGLLYRFRYWVTEWLSCMCFDGHICASRYLERFYRQRLKSLFKQIPVHYSPYAYDPPPRESVGGRSLPELGGNKCIFYLGSFRESYDMWTMLHALSAVVRKRDDCIAILGGRGPDEAKAKAWLESEGLADQIRMIGYIAEEVMPAAMARADVFLCPLLDSKQDRARCPSKLFIYYPYRKPIVTCAIGEAKELLADEGYYYSPGNVDSMVEQIEQAMDFEGYTSAADPEKYSWDSRARSFLNWLKGNYQDVI
jgi:glycosyltransferase involved in cell wall biosynthesis